MALNIGRVRANLCKAILVKYAKLNSKHEPVVCIPSNPEKFGLVPRLELPGTDGKVIFPDITNANQAGQELGTLYSCVFEAYSCGRSKTDHYHLTRRKY